MKGDRAKKRSEGKLSKTLICLFAVTAALVFVPGASASLVISPTDQFGTGLGAVSTLFVTHDPQGGSDNNGLETGCVRWNGTTDVFGNSACAAGGGINLTNELTDENTGVGGTYAIGSIGLAANQTPALVVNISETGNDQTATLTALYFQFYDAAGNLVGSPFTISQTYVLDAQAAQGAGGSGYYFVLDAAQAAIANSIIQTYCPSGVAGCTALRIGGGLQFAQGTTDDGNDTLYLAPGTFAGQTEPPPNVPEPATNLLLGGGLVAIAFASARMRRKAVR